MSRLLRRNGAFSRRGVMLGVLGFAASAGAAEILPGVAGTDAIAPAAPAPDPLPVAPAPTLRDTVPAQPLADLPTWRRYAVAPPATGGRPTVTIVIDDLGELRGPSERVVALQAPLTLAWFPFAKNLPDQVGAAAARGHEIMLHMPMQASFTNSIAQTGPDPLRVDLAPAVNLARLQKAIEAVPQAVGLNNHMGTLATRNEPLMELVAGETHRRGMLFLDSMVVPHSRGLPAALQAGVPAAANDFFLDPIQGGVSVVEQLERAEQAARHRGYVICIGHPHPKTIEGLAAWLPTVAAKGLVLWPLSAAVAFRNRMELPSVQRV